MNSTKTVLFGLLIFAGATLAAVQWTSVSSAEDTPLSYATPLRDGEGKPPVCEQAWRNGIDLLRAGWQQNLQALVSEPKPTSDMVDDAFDDLRTYRCWLEYLCESVAYSGTANAKASAGTGLTSAHLATVPGCQKPQDLTLSEEWQRRWSSVITSGVPKLPSYDPKRFTYIPQCAVGREAALFTRQACTAAIAEEFSVTSDSLAVTTLRRTLQSNSGEQKARALSEKLEGILTRMQSMELHATSLKGLIDQFDARMPCYLATCQ